ncbi:39S ribosomal protein L34, mitochondrial [Lutzomyia longipalpis]|uniref:39S ribosomal protein L34, mitochondrial n=1 Tax=Lutzomyia longipalpis TaxID=7200 RepID=UPI0024837CA4|nr:39S ribosomal protein L34, mitochondrial [Lutzomyia longipalpis]
MLNFLQILTTSVRNQFLQRGFHSVTQNSLVAPKPGGLWSLVFSRTNIRNNFPRPSEVKRVKKLGLEARLATAGGRRVIMRRILKGRHVLSH